MEWIVGTAVYQVQAYCSMTWKNRRAENLPFRGRMRVPPEQRVVRVEAMRPWMWKRGMTLNVVSVGVRERVEMILETDARRLEWVSGTAFGAPVVPDV